MNECYFTQFNGVIADLKREVNNLAVIFKGKRKLRDIGDMTQPIDDVHNNGVHNNGDGVDSECDVHSTLPLCQPNCLAPTPTSPMRVGSSRRHVQLNCIGMASAMCSCSWVAGNRE